MNRILKCLYEWFVPHFSTEWMVYTEEEDGNYYVDILLTTAEECYDLTDEDLVGLTNYFRWAFLIGWPCCDEVITYKKYRELNEEEGSE